MTQTNDDALPQIRTGLSEAQVVQRLRALSKRGKLPGFSDDEPGASASVAAHGAPFDSKLLVKHAGGSDSQNGPSGQDSELRFECVMLPTMPRVFALLLVITIWPGLPLTDQFLSSLEWYANLMASIGIDTWHWYLPLTVLPAPFAWRSAIKKSQASARESALEAIEKIRGAIS